MWKEILRRIRYLGRRPRFEAELEDEIRFHLEARADELERAGMERRATLAQARRELGPSARIAEEARAAWQFRWLEDLFSDLRYAARAFRRNPAFALTAIACLALGIGANTTIFSIATEALFSQPSVRDPQTLLHLRIGGNSHSPLREYRFLRDARIFDGLAGENEESEVNWRHGNGTDRLFAVRVTDNFFDVTGIPVALGRPIQAGERDTVVLAHGFWQRRLAGDPHAPGRTMILDGRVYTVAGVLPRDHRTVTGYGFSPDLYLPVSDENTVVAFYARMPRGVTRAIAYQRLKAACRELDRVYPEADHKWADEIEVSAVAGIARLQSESQFLPVFAFFGMLMVVVGLVLLIACANVAGLLMARAYTRSHELAIRLSIGAGRGRIVRQLLAESLLLALCGTAAGLALNVALTSLAGRYQLPIPFPIRFQIDPDWRLLSYGAAVALGTAVITGMAPALGGTRSAVSLALKGAEHQVGRDRWTFRNALAVGQLAVSIVLLCAAFLFTRNLLRASAMSPGFDAGHAVWAHMRLVPEAYPHPAKIRALADTALEQLRGLPGVEATAIARVVPLNDNLVNGAGLTPDTRSRPVPVTFHTNYVSDGYFQVMGIPIVEGREFLPSDRPGSPPVAIVNQNLARRLFDDVSPVGHTVRWAQAGGWITIAGVARNSKYFTLGEANAYAWYAPYAQSDESVADLHFLVRATRRPEPLLPAIHAVLDRLDPAAALEIRPMSQALDFAMLPSRMGAAILGSMGLLGLALASVGLYGTLLYAVSRRIREIGLRVALGAGPAEVLRLVLRQSFLLVGVGLAIGITLAVFAVRPLAMFLVPEVRPADAANFIVVGTVLCLVALLATVSPAVRALRVDPVVALRHE